MPILFLKTWIVISSLKIIKSPHPSSSPPRCFRCHVIPPITAPPPVRSERNKDRLIISAYADAAKWSRTPPTKVKRRRASERGDGGGKRGGGGGAWGRGRRRGLGGRGKIWGSNASLMRLLVVSAVGVWHRRRRCQPANKKSAVPAAFRPPPPSPPNLPPHSPLPLFVWDPTREHEETHGDTLAHAPPDRPIVDVPLDEKPKHRESKRTKMAVEPFFFSSFFESSSLLSEVVLGGGGGRSTSPPPCSTMRPTDKVTISWFLGRGGERERGEQRQFAGEAEQGS